MHTFFTILAFLPAFIAGLDVIPYYWVGVSVVAAYLDSILFVGERIGGDFRSLGRDEFMRVEKARNMALFGSVVLIALTFGVGRLVAWIVALF